MENKNNCDLVDTNNIVNNIVYTTLPSGPLLKKLNPEDIVVPLELLLTPEIDRHTIFPIRFPKIWNAYQDQINSMWRTHEVDLTNDKKDWDKLTRDERHFLKMILGFFASADLIVNENLTKRFIQEVQVLEAKLAYDFQKAMENIHSEMYSLLIDTYISDIKEKTDLFNAIKTIPIVGKMAAWAEKWMDSDRPFTHRLVAFSVLEGVFFSAPFCSIYWVKERGILPGLCKSNDFIARDEGMHTSFAILLHDTFSEGGKCPCDILHEIVSNGVDVAIEFITEALPCSLLGMNAEQMKKYVKYVANRLVLDYGYPELYPGSVCPFPFMERINLKSKSNFFEKKPTEYSNKGTQELEDDDPYACFTE